MGTTNVLGKASWRRQGGGKGDTERARADQGDGGSGAMGKRGKYREQVGSQGEASLKAALSAGLRSHWTQ